MKRMIALGLIAGCAMLVAGSALHAEPAVTKAAPAAAKTETINEAVANSEKFRTLAAALKAAGLDTALQGSGPFTVFAPSDEAFAKLPEGTLEMLLKPENKDKLASILKYHVVAGKAMAKDVISKNSWKTLQGEEVVVTQAEGGVLINNARVVKADIACSNGVIHVIDSVLLPK